jgi:integrase
MVGVTEVLLSRATVFPGASSAIKATGEEALFSSKSGISELSQTSGPEVRFHDLRHTCATLLLTKGVHPKLVQEMLGRSTISTALDIHSHVLPNMHKEL